MFTLTLTSIGDAVGVVLPEEVRARLKLAEGDTLYLTEDEEGYRLTPRNPNAHEQMEMATDIMRKRRDALRELAK
ncbi:MAG: AbrB/MazE/SpoVT family DNA-binding domain-containing protein [Methylobacterium frigidaeris]